MTRAELFRLLRSRPPWLVFLATLAFFAVFLYQHYDNIPYEMAKGLKRLMDAADDEGVRRGFASQTVEEYRAAFRPAMGPVLALGYMASGPGLLLTVLAATWVFGSEYSSNTMRLLLLHQPNRLRVVGAKLAVLVGLLVFLTVAIALVLTFELWVLDRVKPIASLDAPAASLSLAPPVRLFSAWFVPLATGVSISVLAAIVTRSNVASLLTPAVLLLGDFILGKVAPAVQTWTLSYNMWRGAAPYGAFAAPSVSAQVWYASYELVDDATRSIVLLSVVAILCTSAALVVFRRQEYH